MRILFVCLGNICRSPTAEGVMRHLVAEAGVADQFEIESAGTAAWHVGKSPDPRTVEAATARGIHLTSIAQQVTPDDFTRFDLIVAMDRSNRDDLMALRPVGGGAEVHLLRDYADGPDLDVPDPYYRESDGFAEVLEIVERNCAALLASCTD